MRHLKLLCISPLTAILQQGRKLRLIYGFSCSGLNKWGNNSAPKELMMFGKYLYRLLDFIMKLEPNMVPTFLNKVDLAEICMHLWVRLEYTPSVSFLVPRASPTEDQLIRFPLYIPMGYIESTNLFFTEINMVKDRVLATIPHQYNASTQHLESLIEHPHPPLPQQNSDSPKCNGLIPPGTLFLWKRWWRTYIMSKCT